MESTLARPGKAGGTWLSPRHHPSPRLIPRLMERRGTAPHPPPDRREVAAWEAPLAYTSGGPHADRLFPSRQRAVTVREILLTEARVGLRQDQVGSGRRSSLECEFQKWQRFLRTPQG